MPHIFGDRWLTAEREPIGVIDIGSNSVRLVIYEGAVRAATPVFNEKVLCGLGRSIHSTGRLSDEAIERAIGALARFRVISRIVGVKVLRVIATAAVREAENGREFIARGEKACGAKIEILSGEKEAELAAHGIRMGFREADGFAGDLGGGSLELIDIYRDTLNEATTMPLGGLRLIDSTGDKLDKALALIDESLGKIDWLAKGAGRPFYAVGGTWRALAKLHMDETNYPLRVMQGYSIPTRDAILFCEKVRKTKKLSLLPGIDDVARARREVLPYGALVLERLLKLLAPSEVIFSVYGIREGLVFSLLPEVEQRKDPLLCFCEDYSRLRSRSYDHAVELCAWTDVLFDSPDLTETADEKRLRHAACLMSDIGWRAHPDYRGEKSLNIIAQSGLVGTDHPGRMFIAMSVFFRHVGSSEQNTDQLSERIKGALSKRALKRARIVGAAIRAAHMVSIGMPGVIDETPLSFEDGKLVLTLPKSYASLDGERLRRRMESLAALLQLTAEVRAGR
ncbi:MAG: Ppx/GppA phosphatase family protein [Hyphomicrobiaceae bacterium]|nr:Ppx/GppA phosphatase family protein [Hyphomicrobiaceae bacterium]